MDIVSEAGKGNSRNSVPNDFVPLSSQPPHQDTSEDGGGSNNARMYDHYHQQQQKQQQQQHRPLQQQQEQQQQQNRPLQQQQEQQQQQQKAKRKHRRGKPKPKNANKPYKKINWKFQIPRPNYNCKGGHGGANSGGSSTASRAKLLRSRSLVPYNTNKFLMEEHLAEVPSSLLTPSGRTRDSSFSIDSDENYFHCLPEDEEEFLTKEFDNIYENSRVERLENMTKQQLIEECLQIEDRYSSDQGTQHLQQLQVQRISSEFAAKIRVLEEKIRELTRENFDLRSQLMRSAALAAAAAASPPSAAAPTASACQPTPMDSTSEDSESDSSTSSSSAASFRDENNAIESDDDLVGSPNYCGAIDVVNENLNDVDCASTSSGSPREYIIEAAVDSVPQPQGEQQLLGACMEEDDQFNTSNDAIVRSSSNYVDAVGAAADEHTHSDSAKSDSLTAASTELQTPL